jgi:hypothetical protein
MPSARLKLVKLAAPSAAASSLPFCNSSTCAQITNREKSISLACEGFDFGKRWETGSEGANSLAVSPVPLPPQLHHFSSKAKWMCHYRRWLKNSKAVWMQRLQRQHSILHFFSAEHRQWRSSPRKSATVRATKPASNRKLKNATLEVYGARAGTFKTPRCCPT